MYVLLAVLGALALGEAGLVWWVWRKYRTAQDSSDVADSMVSGFTEQLMSTYNDLAEARRALVAQNDLEAKTDAKTVSVNPDLDAAIARINGL